jgi:hypothetical protein
MATLTIPKKITKGEELIIVLVSETLKLVKIESKRTEISRLLSLFFLNKVN